MYLLALDTATNSGGAALARNHEVIGVVMVKTPLRYSETLLDYVDFLLCQFDLEIGQIDCFGVTTGPGSFTGLRVGLATAKAFCQALDRPCVGISTLEALAYRFRWVHHQVAPLMDARRQQIFGAVYAVDGAQIRVEKEPRAASPAEWLKSLEPVQHLFVGDGALLYKKTIAALHPQSRVLETDNRLLEALCQLAYLRFTEGKTLPAAELRADYVRPADVELRGNP